MTDLAPDVWALAADQIDPPTNDFMDRPVEWVKEKLGEHNTYDQKTIMRSVVENRYTAVQSCHDSGKSYTASRVAGWWIDSHPPGEAFVVSTAPTTAQVGAILWREIGKAHRKGNLPGRITMQNEWKYVWGDGPDELIGQGRKPADYDEAAFQGIHARFVLVIIDEAGGVPENIFNAVDALVTNKHSRVLAIGNPDDPTSHFARVCKPGSGWNVIRINGLEQPTFSEKLLADYPLTRALMKELDIPPSIESIPHDLHDLLISPMWVEERIRRWGKTSPLFTSKVLGKFPEVSKDALIEPSWITAAQIRELPVHDLHDSSIGVDVARMGDDKTILVLRECQRARVVWEGGKTTIPDTVGQVQYVIDRHQARPTACVDDVGVGGGVTDMLSVLGYDVRPFIGGAAATDMLPNGKKKFVNLRSQEYWNLREAFRLGYIDIDPDDEDLAAQLGNIKYGVNLHGQIWVETKDDMKKRGIESPDRADALMMGWFKGVFDIWDVAALEGHRGTSITSDLMTAEM